MYEIIKLCMRKNITFIKFTQKIVGRKYKNCVRIRKKGWDIRYTPKINACKYKSCE